MSWDHVGNLFPWKLAYTVGIKLAYWATQSYVSKTKLRGLRIQLRVPIVFSHAYVHTLRLTYGQKKFSLFFGANTFSPMAEQSSIL